MFFHVMTKVIMPEKVERKYLCSFQLSWKSFKIHNVISFACSFLCILCNEPVFHHFKHLLKDEIDLSLEMSAFLYWIQREQLGICTSVKLVQGTLLPSPGSSLSAFQELVPYLSHQFCQRHWSGEWVCFAMCVFWGHPSWEITLFECAYR